MAYISTVVAGHDVNLETRRDGTPRSAVVLVGPRERAGMRAGDPGSKAKRMVARRSVATALGLPVSRVRAASRFTRIKASGEVLDPGSGRVVGFVLPAKRNPGIRAQVRRLPSGQVQLRVPLKKGENPMAKAQQLAKAMGQKVVSVSRMKNGRVCNPAEVDKDAAHELELYIENDAQLYRSQYTPINKNLATKMARGTYDRSKAVKLFMYLMESGAKKYAREFGGPGDNWSQMFNVPTRRAAAERFADSFETEYGLGNYDHLLPKKYQKKSKSY